MSSFKFSTIETAQAKAGSKHILDYCNQGGGLLSSVTQ